MSKSTVSITYKVEELAGGFKKITAEIEGVDKMLKASVSSGEKLKTVFFELAAVTTTFQNINKIVQDFSKGVDELTFRYASFDDAMRKANTMAGKGGADFEALKEKVSDLGKEIPVARDALAEGLYQVVSNGVPEDNWIAYLETSAKSAVGGVADLGKVVNVTSTVIKNYGLDWDKAVDIQDKIQLTAKNGVTSFEQLSDALPRVTANAATLGVSVDELLATFATLTGVSGNTAEVSTQLAAIFTALIKPSSEASQMAMQMGIQFDAAAIKAAGGMGLFLKQLDASVKSFSKSSGMLEKEVYGKLFGSAESLRALTPLTGQLADKYAENVAAMVDSSGAMADAYATNAESITNQNIKAENSLSDFMDSIGAKFASIQPLTNLIATCSNLTMSVMGLVFMFKQLNVITGVGIALKKAYKGVLITINYAFSAYSKSAGVAAIATNVLKTALRGLLLATGVVAVIYGITAAIDYFCESSDDAADSTDRLTAAQRAEAVAAEAAAEANQAGTKAGAEAEIQIRGHIKAIQDFNGTKEEEQKLLNELQSAYGDFMGNQSTLAKWYDTLTAKSQDYCDQMIIEAKTARYKDKIVAAEVAFEEKWGKHGYTYKRNITARAWTDAADDSRKKARSGGSHGITKGVKREELEEKDRLNAKANIYDGVAADAEAIDAIYDQFEAATNAVFEGRKKLKSSTNTPSGPKKISEKSVTELQAQKSLLEKQLQDSNPGDQIDGLKKEYKEVTDTLAKREKALGLSKSKSGSKSKPKKVVDGDDLFREQYATNIELYTKKLTSEDTAEQRMMREKIAKWKEAIYQIDLAQKKAERPAKLETLKDISDEISYQRFLREHAQGEAIAGIDAEISRLETLGRKMELSGYIAKPVDEIKTYKELNAEISKTGEILESAYPEERESILKRKRDLEELKKQWDAMQAAYNKPADLAQLNSLEKLSEAKQYYSDLQKNADADEYMRLQKIINGIDRKTEALQRGSMLLSNQQEINDIQSLAGKDFTLKVKSIGFDALTDKIKELNKQLNDLDNPPTEGQRKIIESQIRTYEEWRRKSVDTFGTIKNGWGAIQGMSGGLQSITDALSGQASVWERVTGIVNGFIQVYEGVQAIISIIQMLTTLSEGHAAAKVVEAGATGAAGVAEGVAAGASEAAAAAELPLVAANKATAASFMELATAAFFAAHAYIPFAGFAIASAFATSAKAMVETMGAIAFADGGIVSGPTLGLVGEYAGASHNPEVIAPLNKLKTLIEPRDSGMGGHVEFEIDGRKLRGVLQRVNNVSNRS